VPLLPRQLRLHADAAHGMRRVQRGAGDLCPPGRLPVRGWLGDLSRREAGDADGGEPLRPAAPRGSASGEADRPRRAAGESGRARPLESTRKTSVRETEEAGPQSCQLATDAIAESPLNPREQYDEASLASLADSIRVSGIIQPVVARRVGETLE